MRLFNTVVLLRSSGYLSVLSDLKPVNNELVPLLKHHVVGGGCSISDCLGLCLVIDSLFTQKCPRLGQTL